MAAARPDRLVIRKEENSEYWILYTKDWYLALDYEPLDAESLSVFGGTTPDVWLTADFWDGLGYISQEFDL